ncbi:uncharacterized protein EV154DRAFT_479907 [Mucor mucedo]|uniref:uncharacterized protein n=1 Tax=Mucor mucedo TaxID=29922 RepID=UPI002220D44B|nr:uncharacterized protein EV154DRAFT_479907 [Mucor mucedo]KAI7892816.1 hypothetical protein EV154DRAFT_479907 [Mucor mucedo]
MSLDLLTAQEKAERRREKNKLAQRKYQLRLRQQRIEENEVEETRRIRERNNLLKRKQRDSFTPEENEAHRARMRQYVHNRAQNDPLFLEAEAERARRNRETSLVPEDRSDIPEDRSDIPVDRNDIPENRILVVHLIQMLNLGMMMVMMIVLKDPTEDLLILK